jgi:hypothetical protein
VGGVRLGQFQLFPKRIPAVHREILVLVVPLALAPSRR